MMEEVERVRSDLNARIERHNKEELNNRISALEKELSGQFVQMKCSPHTSRIYFSVTKARVTLATIDGDVFSSRH